MNDIKNIVGRIKSKRDELRLSQAKLAKQLGWNQSRLGNYETGKRAIPAEALDKIAEGLGVSKIWLRYGDDTTGNTYTTNNYYGHSSGNTIEGGNVAAIGGVESNSSNDDEYEGMVSIPCYDIKLSAGTGLDFDWSIAELEDPVMLPKSWFKRKRLLPSACKAMEVKGYSMSPVLESGDIVVINTNDNNIDELEDGEMYAVIYNRQTFIKEIRRTSSGLKLVSFNERFEDIEVNYENLSEQLIVLGKKVWRGG